MTIDFRKFNLAVVIPAYQVADTIETVLNELPEYLCHIIVVDDASSDNTSELVQAYAERDRRIVLLRHARHADRVQESA
jgi:glycosyltransferase involved in cell wall biosynthesis